MYATRFLDIPALATAQGSLRLPGSKSISNRVLLLSALCAGSTTVHDLLDSDDTQVMLEALRQLGCAIQRQGTSITIEGMGGSVRNTSANLFMGNAGTAIRPLTAALSVIGGQFELRGVERMHERPIGDLVDALRQLGCQIDYLQNPGYPPLRIGHPTLRLGQPIQVRGDVSSQFLTALLMALPLVATRDIVIDVMGELISRPYIEITLNLLAKFGVRVRRDQWQRFTIAAGSRLQSPGQVYVEADASSASYFVALGAIAGVNQPVRIEGVGAASIQGDIRFIDAARQMGAHIDSGANWLSISRGQWPLKAIDLDCNHIPDAAMTLAVMAMYAQGTSTLRNIASWRVKETDRLSAMACELRKLGASVEEGADFLRISPPADITGWRSASIHTYDDHRIAMCFSLAAFNPAQRTVRIEDPKCVAKTYPDYFEDFFELCTPVTDAVPVITIDGPTASGKGTLAEGVAKALGYHLLDSGALYRIVGLAALEAGLSLSTQSESEIAALATNLPIQFTGDRVLLAGRDITEQIRREEAGMNASKVSALPLVRQALLDLQLRFRKLPGLVADGRDMGTVIFPGAPLKVFLTASVDARAQRRHSQLISKGISVTLPSLRADLQARDERDTTRAISPLKPAQDAQLLDNSGLSIEASIEQVLRWWQSKPPQRFGAVAQALD